MGESLPSPHTARCSICGKLSWMCPHPWEARIPQEKWEGVMFTAHCRKCKAVWGTCEHDVEHRAIVERFDLPQMWPMTAKYIATTLGLKQEVDVDALLAEEKTREARRIAAEAEEAQRLLMLEPYELWCDGSATLSDGPAGAGVVLYRWKKVLAENFYPLGTGSNNFAEISAIGRGLWLLLGRTNGKRDVPVVVCTDSEFAIGAIEPGSTWNVNDGLQKIVAAARAEVAQWPNLTFRHVNGHTGVMLNERADKLAKMGRRRVIETTETPPLIAYLDTETTGTDASRCQILSAYIALVRGDRLLNEYEVRFRLTDWARVEQGALRVNGIDPYHSDWIESSMDFRSSAQILVSALEQADAICAHNADFDIRFIRSALQRERLPFPPVLNAPPICTMRMAAMLQKNGFIQSKSLAAVCEYYGVEIEGAHTARGDTHAVRRFYRKLRTDYELLKR